MTSFEFTRDKVQEVSAVLQAIEKEGRYDIYEHEVYKILRIMDLQTPVHTVVRVWEDITDQTLAPFKSRHIIVKVISRDIPHKTRVGGVKKTGGSADAVRETVQRMGADIPLHPSFTKEPEIYGYLICECIEYTRELGNEILLGIRENMAFGPVISISKGGSDAEHFARHYSTPNTMLSPLSIGGSRQLLERTRIILKYIEENHYDYI